MKPLSSEELKQLKVGDIVFIDKRYVTVEKVGTKFITTSSRGDKISIVSAMTHHPNYSQWCRLVYRTEEDKQAYDDYCKSLDSARKFIVDSVPRLRAKELLQVQEFIQNLRKEKGA